MLLFNADLLVDDPFAFTVLIVSVLFALLLGITVHEFSHAAAATLRGDITAQRLGRLTLNPKAHLSPAGTIMLLIVGFGWGKPVPVDIFQLRGGRRALAFVSAAGPASNVVLAFAIAALFQIGILSVDEISRSALESVNVRAWASIVGSYAVQLNLILAVFNLLPVPPLDGGGIIAGIAPRGALPAVRQLQRIGPMVLVAVLLSTYVTDLNILGSVFGPVIDLTDALIGS
jgi:Zn-dependent protease